MRAAARDLLERERELGALDALLADAAAGAGGVLLVAGEAGIGKSALLGAAVERARAAGLAVASARGAELERDFAFGVARQLFEPLADPGLLAGAAAAAAPALGLRAQPGDMASGAPPHDAGVAHVGGTPVHDAAVGVGGVPAHDGAVSGVAPVGGTGAARFEVIHGLYWVAANLAERGPLLVAVDDAQWADADSLRFLAYLVRRVAELPVALVATLREGEIAAAGAVLDDLRAEPGLVQIAPAPLGRAAAEVVVRDALGEAAPAFVDACHDVTGGNPFLLHALLDELAGDGTAPSAQAAERVRTASPASVQRSVLVRLARLGPVAVGLAQAVAILERDADLADAAALAGADRAAARAATDVLVTAHILEPVHPLRFVHPLVQAAVYADMGLARRADGHRRAAALLDERAPDRAVGHLLAAHPAGDPWVLERLWAGAERALGRGSLDAARAVLERALAEATAAGDRARILARLGQLERRAAAPRALDRLEAALAVAGDDELRAEVVRELFDVQLARGHDDAARALLEHAKRELPDPTGESWLELEASRVVFMQLRTTPDEARALFARLADRVEPAAGETRAERRLLALLAFHRFIWAQTTAREVGRLAERALGGGRLVAEEGTGDAAVIAALSVLQGVERDREIEPQLAAARADAPLDRGGALVLRARLAHFRGRLADAEVDARAAIELAVAAGLPRTREFALAALLATLVERGQLAAAEAELAAHPFPAERSGTRYVLLQARAGLRRAQGRPGDALADLRAAHEHRSGPGGASVLATALLAEAVHAAGDAEPARRTAARAVHGGDADPTRRTAARAVDGGDADPTRRTAAWASRGAGDAEPARQTAAQAVAHAERWGVAGLLGIALRVQGIVEGGEAGLALLERAESTLAGTPRRLEHARTLVALGAARRRANRRAAARDPLAAGMELAFRCGALALAEHARDELVACGARPRRLVRTGVDALTASELRVARLAAGGASNREIAQALYVSRKTVETHLGAIYRKLDVSARERLGELLAAADEAPPGRSAR